MTIILGKVISLARVMLDHHLFLCVVDYPAPES